MVQERKLQERSSSEDKSLGVGSRGEEVEIN